MQLLITSLLYMSCLEIVQFMLLPKNVLVANGSKVAPLQRDQCRAAQSCPISM